jgi:hypothetical protein
MNFNVSFRDIAYQLIPHFLRTTNFMSYIYSIVKPIRDLNYGISLSDYSAAATYAIGDRVRYNNVYYLCRVTIASPEAFDETKWVSLGMWSNFYSLVDKIQTLLRYDSKTLNLEKYLNWKYDNTLSDFDSYNVTSDTYSKAGVLLANPNNKPRIQVGSNSRVMNFMYNLVETHDPIYFYNNWDSTQLYNPTDRVQYNSNIYVCILMHSNKVPTDPTYWTFQKVVSYYYNLGGGVLNADFIVYVPTALLGTKLAEFNSDIKKYKLAGKTYLIEYY